MTRSGWSESASGRLLPDGRRLHLQHGPIDLIVEAFGSTQEITRAYNQAAHAFRTILSDLSSELPRLRAAKGAAPQGQIAKVMCETVEDFSPEFITPMAAVAGSVADHVLAALLAGRSLSKAYVNNGGDIALHLTQGTFRIGICNDPVTGAAGGIIDIRPEDEIGGIATSGWRGRSHSLGIADAVTVLARTAAQADATATMIANHVDLPSSTKITRAPARDLSPDSDLEDRLVTTNVAALSNREIDDALSAGERAAEHYREKGLLLGAALALAGKSRILSHQEQARDNIREAICA